MARPRFDRLDDCGFPWSAEHPLVFHTITNLGTGASANRALSRLVRDGDLLAPPDKREVDWSETPDEDMEDLDRMAADDRWLFFAVGLPYHGVKCGEEGPVTLAFDLETLFSAGTVGWRPHDLLSTYSKAADVIVGADSSYLIAVLGRISEWATVTNAGQVRRLVRLTLEYARARDLDDLPDAERIAEEILRVIGDRVNRQPDRSPSVRWTQLFHGPSHARGFPLLEGTTAPEVLCDGPVPIRAARFWQDGTTGRWRPMRLPRSKSTAR